MRKIMVANPKGGCGKSTLATHLATWFARSDDVVYLGDLDRQQSSRFWLEQRPALASRINLWDTEEGEELKLPPAHCDVAILDTPAGLHGKPLKALLKEMDRVIVPVSPSRFDMQASQAFFAELAEIKAVRKEKVGIAVVGMRIDPRTHSTRQMVDFLEQFELPLVTCIRNAQRYVSAIDNGITLFDANTPPEQDWVQWEPLINWLMGRRG